MYSIFGSNAQDGQLIGLIAIFGISRATTKLATIHLAK